MLDPETTFKLIATNLPASVHDHVVIVGSIAAAYYHRQALGNRQVQTKDADLVIQPAGDLATCRTIAEQLLTARWRRRADCTPSATPTPQPSTLLRTLRLHPPDSDAYYIEILGLPSRKQHESVRFEPLELTDGWYGVPCFRYLSLVDFEQPTSSAGLRYAAPSMMALANLLSHPEVGTQRMSTELGGRKILRSAKDLGRVLALARLEERATTEAWADVWLRALRPRFPEEWPRLASRVGNGLNALLDNQDAFEEAHHAAAVVGLLSHLRMTLDELRAIAEQFLEDVVEPFRFRAAASAGSAS